MKAVVLLFVIVVALVSLGVPLNADAQPDGFIEDAALRTQTGKVFVDATDPDVQRVITTMAPLHYRTDPDSDVWDAEVDLAPRRVNNAQLDGWLVEDSGWHYALGQPGDKATDGWVGFGGRNGAHWFEFRLTRVGYLHWPVRAWDDIGGAPTYDRAALSSAIDSMDVGGSTLNVSTVATWSQIWTTPDAGSLNVTWVSSGAGLKEEITVNQAGREWIAANRPPATPAAETYFGFVLRLDWSDIPKVFLRGILQDINLDWSPDGDTIELRDAADRLLALLPVGDVYVPDSEGQVIGSHPVKARYWRDPDGNHYLLLGVRVDNLNALPAGDLVFDPTVDVQVTTGGDDCDDENDSFSCSTSTEVDTPGNDPGENDIGNASFRWTGINIPQGSIITAATFSPRTDTDGDDGAGTRSRIYLEASDNATAPTSLNDFRTRPVTANFTAWDDQNFAAQHTQSPGIESAVQEVINRSGWVSGANLQVFWKYVIGQGAAQNYEWRAYDQNPSYGALLNITFTAAPADPPTVTAQAADPVLGNSATLHGNLTDLGGAATVNVSFEWGDTMALGNQTTDQTVTTTGPFQDDVTGLTVSTTYYFRARADGDGTNYSAILNFTTQSAFVPPDVTTDPVIASTQTMAVLAGRVTTLGELNITQANVSFEWGLSPAALIYNTTPETVSIPGTFQATISDLEPGVTYYYRAVIQWQPTAFGDVESFTTEFPSFWERPDAIAAVVLSVLAILLCILGWKTRQPAIMALCGVVVILAGVAWVIVLSAADVIFAALIGTAILGTGLIVFILATLGRRRR